MLSIIAAISQNRVIGNENKLLWNIPEDLQRFKRLTIGHPIIMGRKTFESIGRPLPKRTNIILTRDKNFRSSGCIITHSLTEALEKAKQSGEIFIIGGGQIYSQAINLADKLYLTVVHQNFTGDAIFPDYSRFKKIVFQQSGQFKSHKYTFFELLPDL